MNLNNCRLSVFGQLAHKFPELVNKDLSHGFYVAHRLDYSTSGRLIFNNNMDNYFQNERSNVKQI